MIHGAGHELIHWTAAIVLVIGGAIFLLLAARERLAVRESTIDTMPAAAGARVAALPGQVDDRPFRAIVAGLSLGAAVIHLAEAPSHFIELGDVGAGFLAAAVFQAAWARAALAGLSERTAAIGILGNAAVVAAWAWARTIGLPVEAEAGRPEPVGLPDAAATLFEALIILALAAGWLGRRMERSLRASQAPRRAGLVLSIAAVPVLGLVAIATSLATLAVAAGADHGPVAGGPHASIESVPAHSPGGR
jgi:hypothetical protein